MRLAFALMFPVILVVGTTAHGQNANTQNPFYGVWKLESMQFNGEERANDATRKILRLSVENGEYKLFQVLDPAKGVGNRIASAGLTVDETKKIFTLTFNGGAKNGKKIHGIYEATATSLKLCYGPSDKPLPTKFEAAKGSESFCETWTREK